VRVIGRRHDAGRLVEKHVRERLGRERASVQLDPIGGLDEGRQACDLAVHAHPAGPDQLLGAPAGGHAGPREVGVQAHSCSFR